MPIETQWGETSDEQIWFLGNHTFIKSETISGDIPFCIILENISSESQLNSASANIAIKYEEGQTYTLEIKYARDKNYFPSELLEFTTCTQKTLLPLTTFTQSGMNSSVITCDFGPEFASATNLDIYVDNILYANQSVMHWISYEGEMEERIYCVGNSSLSYPNDPDTEENFFIMLFYNNYLGIIFKQSEDETASHTLAIVSKDYTIKEEYLPYPTAEDLEVITLLLNNDMLPVLMEDENTVIAEKDGTMLLI